MKRLGDGTAIRLKRSTKKRLDALLKEKGESYDDLVRRLLDSAEEVKKSLDIEEIIRAAEKEARRMTEKEYKGSK